MTIDDGELAELKARVYSRAGAAEPRVQRVDPLTGLVVEATESEWRLLQERRSSGPRDAEGPMVADGGPGAAESSRASNPPRLPRWSRRGSGMTHTTAALLGFVVAAVLFGGWLWISTVARAAPSVDLVITPTPAPEVGATSVPEDATFDIFRDPDARMSVLPWWLMQDFPIQQVAELVPSDGIVPGASIYAAISNASVTCIVVRLEPNGLNWNCTSTEHVGSSGLTMHTAIPANLGSARDGDGDGVSGDWSDTDELTVEWRPDGSFVVTRGG